MALTITLNDVKINHWMVDIENLRVIANYSILKDTGEEYGGRQEAIFWVTMPEQTNDPWGNPLPYPDNWYTLPEEYVTQLANLTSDARLALLHLVNE